MRDLGVPNKLSSRKETYLKNKERSSSASPHDNATQAPIRARIGLPTLQLFTPIAAAMIGIIPATLMIPAYYWPILGVENAKLQWQRILNQSEKTKTNRAPTEASVPNSGSVPQVSTPPTPAATTAATILDPSRQRALRDADEDYRINAAQGYRSYDRLFQRLPQELSGQG